MATERQRLLAALRRTVGEQGCQGVTVDAVVNAAGLPRERFAAHFGSKDEALGEAQEEFLERIGSDAERSCDPESQWPDRVRAGLASVIGVATEAEGLARALTVEVPGGSLAARQRQVEALDRFATMLERGRRFYPRAAALPRVAERFLVGGVASILTELLLGEEGATLRELESQLLELLLIPYLGPEQAHQFVEG